MAFFFFLSERTVRLYFAFFFPFPFELAAGPSPVQGLRRSRSDLITLSQDPSFAVEQRRHSNPTNPGEHARPSVKVSGVSRAKRSFLDSNQGLRVPIRDVHCAWVYREYDRGKSPHWDGTVEKGGSVTSRSPSPALRLALSFSLRERHLSRAIMCDSLISSSQH